MSSTRFRTGRRSRSSILFGVLTVLSIFVLAIDILHPSHPISTIRATVLPVLDKPSKPANVNVVVSVVWDGHHIREYNLHALQEMRERFPKIAMIHFLSPAYFLRKNVDKEIVQKTIRSALHPNDKIGLHVQPWKSLTSKAGIPFKPFPTFWGNKLDDAACAWDCGHEVPLAVYPQNELITTIRTAKQVLIDNGFGNPNAFLAGGWLATNNVLAAVAANRIPFDFSIVDPEAIRPKFANYPLFEWLTKLWASQERVIGKPYTVRSPYGDVIEFGNAGAAIDFLSVDQVLHFYESVADAAREDPENEYIFHISVHQETAMKFTPRLIAALERILNESQQLNANLRFVTVPNTNESNGYRGD